MERQRSETVHEKECRYNKTSTNRKSRCATQLTSSPPPHPCLPSRRVRAALDIPDRYGIPMVVSTGYPAPSKDGENGAGGRSARRWRYPPQEVVFDGSFGVGMAGVDPVVP